MRKLGDFLNGRMVYAGFPTVVELAQASGISRPTWNAAFEWVTEDDAKASRRRRDTLETMAHSLRFTEWAKLEEAWKSAQDAMVGLGDGNLQAVPVIVPRELFERLRRVASTLGTEVSIAKAIDSILDGKREKPPAPVAGGKGK